MPGKKPENAKERAAAMLGARPYSRRELLKKLIEKGETPEASEEAVSLLEDIGAINDAAYASTLVRYYSAKGCGPSRIKNEFFKRGVPKELWEQALDEMPDMDKSINAFVARRLKGREPDRGELKKLSDALARRGFSWEDIRGALERYENERNS